MQNNRLGVDLLFLDKAETVDWTSHGFVARMPENITVDIMEITAG